MKALEKNPGEDEAAVAFATLMQGLYPRTARPLPPRDERGRWKKARWTKLKAQLKSWCRRAWDATWTAAPLSFLLWWWGGR